jgi:hypothetical protein
MIWRHDKIVRQRSRATSRHSFITTLWWYTILYQTPCIRHATFFKFKGKRTEVWLQNQDKFVIQCTNLLIRKNIGSIKFISGDFTSPDMNFIHPIFFRIRTIVHCVTNILFIRWYYSLTSREVYSGLCLFLSIVYSVFQRCPTRDEISFPVGQSNCTISEKQNSLSVNKSFHEP